MDNSNGKKFFRFDMSLMERLSSTKLPMFGSTSNAECGLKFRRLFGKLVFGLVSEYACIPVTDARYFELSHCSSDKTGDSSVPSPQLSYLQSLTFI